MLEKRGLLLIGTLVSILTACSIISPVELILREESRPTQSLVVNSVNPRLETFTPHPVIDQPVTQTPSPVNDPTQVPTLTPLPDPYDGLTIASLLSRTYGSGELVIHEILGSFPAFNRYLISYPSDELTIYGFINIPTGDGPFPVVIAIHGYIDPAIYTTLDYTTGYADALAAAGYLVLHPNLRGYHPSDDGTNTFRVGMANDVLNLIGILKENGGKPGPLEKADSNGIGIWGHSMGGGISIRVITVSPDIQAAVLYGAMSGDERKNYESIYQWSEGQRGSEELAVPDEDLARISPAYFLDQIQAAVSIHHGGNDTTVPIEWSMELCDTLEDEGKTVECWIYPDQPHTFVGSGIQLFNQRVIEFYNRHLKD